MEFNLMKILPVLLFAFVCYVEGTNGTSSLSMHVLPSASIFPYINNGSKPNASSSAASSRSHSKTPSSSIISTMTMTTTMLPVSSAIIITSTSMPTNVTMTLNTTVSMSSGGNFTAHTQSTGSITATTQPITTQPTTPVHPTATPTKSAGGGDDDDGNMKTRLWIAGSFAVFFAITTVILGYMVYRQRRINRDLDDPAASRLL